MDRYDNYLKLIQGEKMDKEIKRILKLKSIPGFKISPQEEIVLQEWKDAQKPVKIKPKKTTRKKKTTNEVKKEEKETGEIETEVLTPEVETIDAVILKES